MDLKGSKLLMQSITDEYHFSSIPTLSVIRASLRKQREDEIGYCRETYMASDPVASRKYHYVPSKAELVIRDGRDEIRRSVWDGSIRELKAAIQDAKNNGIADHIEIQQGIVCHDSFYDYVNYSHEGETVAYAVVRIDI